MCKEGSNMILSFRIKNYTDRDLRGFIEVLTNNGYSVNLRKNSSLALMCDVTDANCKVRDKEVESEVENEDKGKAQVEEAESV